MLQVLHNPAQRRPHLLRLCLGPKDGRPLPDSMVERYLTMEVGERGGILGPDTNLNVTIEQI